MSNKFNLEDESIQLIYVDLFYGAGGTSTGVENARHQGKQCAKVIACVNHDANTIASHAVNHPEEIWKDIVGYEGYYEVSNLGNIRRSKSRRLRNVDYATVYPSILLSAKGKHKTLRVHRIVADAFLPKVDGKTHVNHKNGNKRDNRVTNLEWVTQAENNLHSYRVLGRQSVFKGKIPPNKKINEYEIPEMDKLNKQGISTVEIGRRYGINDSTIRKHLRKLRKNESYMRSIGIY